VELLQVKLDGKFFIGTGCLVNEPPHVKEALTCEGSLRVLPSPELIVVISLVYWTSI